MWDIRCKMCSYCYCVYFSVITFDILYVSYCLSWWTNYVIVHNIDMWFHPRNFIAHLDTSLQQLFSSWMSANLTLISVNVNSAPSVLTLILKQPVPSLPSLSIPNLTTVTLCTGVPKSERICFQLQQIQNCVVSTAVKASEFPYITSTYLCSDTVGWIFWPVKLFPR